MTPYIHPENQGLYDAWVKATQGEEQPVETQEKYYLQYNPGDSSWGLWERIGEREHDLRASFYDGDEKSSPMAEIVLSFLNAVAEVGETLEKQYIPLSQEEIDVRVEEHMARLQAGLEQE